MYQPAATYLVEFSLKDSTLICSSDLPFPRFTVLLFITKSHGKKGITILSWFPTPKSVMQNLIFSEIARFVCGFLNFLSVFPKSPQCFISNWSFLSQKILRDFVAISKNVANYAMLPFYKR